MFRKRLPPGFATGLLVRFATHVLYLACIGLAPSTTALAVAPGSAEIVMLIGNGERRQTPASDWIPAAIREELKGGSLVRTLVNSQMGILLADRTQIRLNQNSQLQIKSAGESAQWSESAVRLNAGRAWSQARPPTVPGGNAGRPPRVTMETPSATMAIRGTDWEVEVTPDGKTQLVVLSGTVSMSNDFGSVEVADGEAATAEIGKAPVKLSLVGPQTRVQWVSSWRPDPVRWVGADLDAHSPITQQVRRGEYAAALARLLPTAMDDPGAALMAADILLYEGDSAKAADLLSPHARDGRGDPGPS